LLSFLGFGLVALQPESQFFAVEFDDRRPSGGRRSTSVEKPL
jgi:hypothetical protein